MLVKITILLLFVLILFSLTRALLFLRSSQSSVQTAKALTWRIFLSLGVFAFILLAFVFGWINPHGLK